MPYPVDVFKWAGGFEDKKETGWGVKKTDIFVYGCLEGTTLRETMPLGIPIELAFKMRPSETVYALHPDYTCDVYTGRNTTLAPYVSPYLPCGIVSAPRSTSELHVSPHSDYSRDTFYKYNECIVGMYLSNSAYAPHGAASGSRDALIFPPDSEVCKMSPDALRNIGVALGLFRHTPTSRYIHAFTFYIYDQPTFFPNSSKVAF